jgi:hypothetical protein
MEKESEAMFYLGVEYGTHCCQPAIPSFSAHWSTISRSFAASSGVFSVSGHSKPATKGRMKTSHFEGSIAYWAATAALERNERTQRELAAFDINFGAQRLVQPADCA